VNEGQLFVVALRLTVPLLILRLPLLGGIISMVLDALDVVIIELVGGSFGGHYSELDKALDYYYLTLELWVCLRWTSAWARVPAILLYGWRGIGVVLFEITDVRPLLLVFPNQFENWWLYCTAVERFWLDVYPRTRRTFAVPFVLLLIPKMGQEYMLHYLRWQPWDWTKLHILHTD
jgi:hypothetical protein